MNDPIKPRSAKMDVITTNDNASSCKTEKPLETKGELALEFPTADKAAFFLRWSRLQKTVEVKEATSGFLRGSIAAPSNESKQKIQKTGPVLKVILNEASGYAAPGEVLALMGPSGSG